MLKITPTAQDASHTSHILTNWSTPSILPPYLPSSPSCIPALSALSDLTPNAPDRAWNLLNTYFQARIREASYTGKHEHIYAQLQVEDVNKAIESVRRMSMGHMLESDGGKRKYSICDEVVSGTKDEENGSVKRLKMSYDEKDEKDEDQDGDADYALHLSPLPTLLPNPTSPNKSTFRPSLRLQIPPTSSELAAHQDLVVELQRATREMEFCRRELEAAEETVRIARARYEDVTSVTARLRSEVQRVERRVRLLPL